MWIEEIFNCLMFLLIIVYNVCYLMLFLIFVYKKVYGGFEIILK